MSVRYTTFLPGQDRRLRAGHPRVYSNELRMDTAAKPCRPSRSSSLTWRALRPRDRLFDRPYYSLMRAEADGLPAS